MEGGTTFGEAIPFTKEPAIKIESRVVISRAFVYNESAFTERLHAPNKAQKDVHTNRLPFHLHVYLGRSN